MLREEKTHDRNTGFGATDRKADCQKCCRAGHRSSRLPEAVIEGTVTPQPPVVHSQEQLAKNQAAIALLEQWRQEDATDDPEEIARRQAELDEFKAAINESHTSNRIIYP